MLNFFNLSLTISNLNYITFYNLLTYLSNPISLLILLILLFFLTIIIIFDITNLTVLLSFSYNNKKIGLKECLLISYNKFINLFHLKNMCLIFLSIFLIPFLNFGFNSVTITSINVFDYLINYISNSYNTLIIYFLIYLLFLIIVSRFLLSINYMILENCSLSDSLNKSNKCINKMSFLSKTIFVIMNFLYYFSYVIFIILGFSIILFVGNIIFYGDIKIINYLLFFIFFILSTFISLLYSFYLNNEYYKNKRLTKGKVAPIKFHRLVVSMRYKRILKHSFLLIVFLSLLSLSMFTYYLLSGKVFYKNNFIRVLEITAHRGASKDFPENTMASFIGAKSYGADWIELDVRQTKDKKIVILHDSNLERVTGVFKEVGEALYDEIYPLDAGFYKGDKFKNEKVPLLEDAIRFAKDNNIKLNIEVKPVGYEVDFEKDIINLINKYDFKQNCAIASQSYEVIKNVKMIDPSIKTIFVMGEYHGNVLDFIYADVYSIDYNYLNEDIINNIHNGGKEVYAWTINKKEIMDELLELGVDNIITDNIGLGKELINRKKYGELFTDFIHVFK